MGEETFEQSIALRNVSKNISVLENLNEKKMSVLHKEVTVEDVAIKNALLRPQSLSRLGLRGLSNLPLETPVSFPHALSCLPTFSCHSLLQAVSSKEKELYSVSAIQNLHFFSTFADASKSDDLLPASMENYIYIGIHQRNGRKSFTADQRIAADHNKKKLVKVFKKKLAYNGIVIGHLECGEVIQLQGDQHKNLCQFLVETELVKIHGF